ncbi:hypothetical protein [Streptomyces sp. SPB074]|uniref:hypothetical protein n=1 Tax=Streptomyces sp. (strain SPB074) TaxID=465543 RepID=UPI00017F17B2|nr:hypothetical protein [Streptomyces sp. SPB074]EDY44753.1 conserved hypothetical protein [Streptomyces sp. SPB074]
MTTTDPAATPAEALRPRRLRSSTVVLGGMGLLAVALSACGSEPDRRCVDRDSYTLDGYKVLADKNCRTTSGRPATTARSGAKPAARPAWYYGSEAGSGRADYGTFSQDSAIQRGGLGCDDDDHNGGGYGG